MGSYLAAQPALTARSTLTRLALAFLAGALGVLIFHQTFIEILHLAGIIPNGAWPMHPIAPLHVPQVLSLAFWGGLWGILMIQMMERLPGANHLWMSFLFGGIFPPLVGMLVVGPLKGNSVDWTDGHRLLLSFAINGVWGLGAALSYRALCRIAR